MANIRKLFDDSQGAYGNFYFDIFLSFLIIISATLFVMKTYSLSAENLLLVNMFDYCIMALFTIEFALRNYFAKDKLKYTFSLYNIFDLLAVLPFWFLPGVSLQYLRAFRIFKLFRFFEKYLGNKNLNKHRTNQILIAKIFSALFILIYVSSALVYTFESRANEQINTFADAVYLSMITVTTVGFGDIVPISQEGRFVVMLVVLFGIFLIPFYIGSLLRFYVKNLYKKNFVCRSCGHNMHDENAVHCKLCGNILYGDHEG